MYLRRIGLFLVTNLGVLLVLAIVVRLLGLDRWIETEVGLDYWGLLFTAAIFGFGGALVSLVISKWIAKKTMGVVIIEQPATDDERWLLETIRGLSTRAKIGMPEVGVFDSPDINAFATGARRDRALVAVSTGLLRSMDQREVTAVLGHEISHVANGDMVTMALLQGVLNTFVIFASRVVGMAVDRTVFRQERGHGPGYWITTIAMQLLLGIFATLIVMWFSRRREFRADSGSAELYGTEPMIGALRRLQHADDVPSELPDSLRAFGIRSGPISGLFRSHPPLEVRISALEQRHGETNELGHRERQVGAGKGHGPHEMGQAH